MVVEKHLALMLKNSVEKYSNRIAMQYQEDDQWHPITYEELGNRVCILSKALIESGFKAKDHIAICSKNRPEWSMADFAVLSINGVTIPVYPSNTALLTEYVLKNAGVKAIFVDDQEQYDKIFSILGNLPELKKIIVFNPDVNLSGSESVHLMDFMHLGEASGCYWHSEEFALNVSESDLATIIYTSGTTNQPKGVELVHSNLFHQFDALNDRFKVTELDRSLSFLPLSHVYERTWSYFIFSKGASNFYLDDPKKVIEVLPVVKPTVMVGVPRLYEKIYAAIMEKLVTAPSVRRKLFFWARDIGNRYYNAIHEGKDPGINLTLAFKLADKLVLHKIRNLVGGEKNFFSAGGAPLSKEIEEFFFAFGLLVCQGYGLTESSPMVTCNSTEDFKFGTVGKPVSGCLVKIAENGEILIKGPNIMRGYYKNEKANKEVFSNGWFHTGDVGHFDKEGYLHITDRIKEMMITSGGKNISPLHVETAIGKDFYIEQVVVIGEKRKFVSALIVPSFPALEEYAKKNDIEYNDRRDLIRKDKILRLYSDRVVAQSQELSDHEKIRAFRLLSDEFTQETGEVTPTLKPKRKFIEEKYKELIEEMYVGL